MEKFKAVEKEMKTKAFSKEGLSAAAKMDPKEKEKAEGCAFLSDMVEELERQVETLEAEEESLTVTTKKGKKDTGKADRLAEISRLTERHKWHQNKLELLLRALENGNVDIEQVNEVKDSIQYYVEENQSPEFLDDDAIYDDFNLEQDEAAWGLANEIDRVSSQDTQSVVDENTDPLEPTKSAGKQKTGSTSEPPGFSTRRPSNQMVGKPPLPALATLNNPLANTTNIPVSTSTMKPAPPPSRPPGETLKYASAAAAAAAASSDKSSIAPLPPPPGSTSTLAPLPPAPSKASANTSPNTVSSVPATAPKPIVTATAPPAPQLQTQSPTTSLAASSSIPPTPALETSEPATLTKSKSAPAQSLEPPREEQERSPEPEEPETPPPPTSAADTGQANGVQIEGEEESIFHLPECLHDLIESFDETKARPTDPTSQPVQRLLNISYATCPDVSDVEKPRSYRPANRFDVPRHYPTEPAPILEDPTLYERIDNDSLFFLFYYRQNTYQQYQAAKALKGQSWRFHKQYQTWFQRHEEPKTITEEYEQGTYRFFDYESTWLVSQTFLSEQT